MNWAGAIVIFVLIWWCAFFAVLPIGVKGRWESEADNIEGADPGAPAEPALEKKALWATLVTVPIWGLTIAIILSGVIDFRD